MADTLDLPQPPALAELIERGPVALFLDFDGTLVEIASAPDAISVPSDLSGRLRKLKDRLHGRLAIVSGRSVSDVGRYLVLDGIACAGSHGAHRRRADGEVLGSAPAPLGEAVVDQIRHAAARTGVDYEPKTHGGALHYRAQPEAETDVLAAAEDIASRHGLALKHGKCVVELVRPGSDKGGAVRAFVEIDPFKDALPVFVGDDVTDEDGFAACADLGGFGVLVGRRDATAAQFSLQDVSDVYEWLDL